MPPTSPSRPQLAIYAAFAIAVLLIGARFLRSGAADGTARDAPPAFAVTTSAGAPDGLSAGAEGQGAAAGRLVVDVKGAVRRPGVYRLAAGARAYDAVRHAGGLTARADRIGVNLAARVVDGGEVVVPERSSVGRSSAAPTAASAGGSDTAASDMPLSIDLNTATEQELDEVTGIGEAKLAAIRAQLGQ